MLRLPFRPVFQISLSTALAGCLALAPLARADSPTSGEKLRTFLTLIPEQEPAQPSGSIENENFDSQANDVPAPEGPEEATGSEALAVEHTPVDPDPEPPKGLGMLIIGATITGLYALPVTVFGTVILASPPQPDDTGGEYGNLIGGVVLFFGIAGLAAGVPLLGVGGARYAKWRSWKNAQNARLSAGLTRSPYGTYSPALTLRF